MQGNNTELTRFIQSMKRNLRTSFGLEVPHSALRASYLLAVGENPHAFAGKAVAPGMRAEPPRRPRPKYVHATVVFEWVYPDEDGGDAVVVLNLETGRLSWNEKAGVPGDIASVDVRKRVRLNYEDDCCYDVNYRITTTTVDWYVIEADLQPVRAKLDPDAWQAG